MYLTPPFFTDCASQVKLGKNVYINHNADMMALGGISIDDGVMIGPECAILTVNHEPKNIRKVMTKAVCIKKNAWLGARVSVLPGVTIGENAIVGTGSVVTKDIPNRYPIGSNIILNSENDTVTVDGLERIVDIVHGSTFLTIPPGRSTLEVYSSSWVRTKPTVKIEFEERYL